MEQFMRNPANKQTNAVENITSFDGGECGRIAAEVTG